MNKIPVLLKKEGIGFQIKEGPCTAGCEYCYERPVVLKLLEKAKKEGKIKSLDYSMSNFDLATFIQKNNEKLNLEMSLGQIDKYLAILKKAKIKRAFLIGSEPCLHSNFLGILDTALKHKINIAVYTSGMLLKKLEHKAVKEIILHLSRVPSERYMENIKELIRSGKEIELRINFATGSMTERVIIFAFYDLLPKSLRKKVPLRYSFSCRVDKDSDPTTYITPRSLRSISKKFISFVDEFKKRYPLTPMQTDRVLFRCSFPPAVWKKYEKKAGLSSVCAMEYIIYPEKGLAFCTPARSLLEPRSINTAQEFTTQMLKIREYFSKLVFEPTFPECVKCKYRLSKMCQGGCAGYKV